MPLITINGQALDVERAGEGDPVVIVHGGWTGAAVWATVAERLRERFDVTAYDRLGYNGSDRPDVDYTRERHEDDLIALIEELDAGRVHLVGNSYGAMVAVAVAGRRPELVRSVVAHEPVYMSLVHSGPVEIARASMRCASARILTGDVEGGTRQFFEDVAMGPGSWAKVPEAFRALAMSNAETFAAEEQAPRWTELDREAVADFPGRILLTQGAGSPAWFSEVCDALARELPHARRRTVAGAGHSPHSTHPEVFAEVAGSFFAAKVALPG